MGSWSVNCGISNISITSGNDCVLLPLKKNTEYEGYLPYLPATLPIFGTYDDYGGLEDILKDDNTKLIAKHFNITIEKFVQYLVDWTTYQREEVDCDYNDIYDEHGNIDLGWVHKYICDLELDEVSWDDETGDIDNELPYRITINTNAKSHIFEFLVKKGDCIEATWEHRIWDAKITNLKQII